MADPLSIAASLIAIAQISGSIISLCYDYRRGIQGAQKEVVQIFRETQSLRNVIEQLIQLVDKDNDSGDEVFLPSLRSLSLNDGFSEFQDDLKKLEGRLRTPVTKWQRIGDQLLWPLRERDVKQALDNIHRMKGVVELGLIADTTSSIIEIQRNTRDLKDRVIDFSRPRIELSEQQQLQVMLEWLGSPDQSVRHNDVCKKRAKDSGHWLVDRSEFGAWNDARTSSFWLNGIPGCGKSVLSSVVIEHIKHRSGSGQDLALAYFYFDFNNVATCNPDVMLRSLISQLSALKGKPPKALESCARQHFRTTNYASSALAVSRDGISQPTTEDLIKILRGITEEFDDTYLVVDGLDECVDQGELLEILDNILSSQADGLHIFLASRRTADIAAVLGSKVAYTAEASGEDVGRDIFGFVQEQLRTHTKLCKWPVTVRDEIRDSLVSGAGGMFRWVDCQLAILGKCVTMKAIRKALKGLPKSLSETYELTLSGIDEDHWEYAIKVLMWLAISRMPLGIGEAADVLAIDLESDDGPVFDEDLRVLDPITEIPAMCTSLVATTTTYVRRSNGDLEKTIELRLAHNTVGEYLLSDEFFLRMRRTVFFANKPQVHSFVAKTSLAYLLSMQETLTIELQQDRPLSRHAAELWVNHYLLAQNVADLERLALQLFRDNGQTEPYRNWCRLFDPSKPWRNADLLRSCFPGSLYYASSEGIEPFVSALLKAGADPNTAGEVHESCLQAAACNGHLSVVRALLKAGANPDSGGGLYETCVMAASASGHAEVVKTLLEHGANPNRIRYAVHGTALTAAARADHVDVVRVLLKGGADPNLYNTKPRDVSPLEAASSRGNKDCVALMLPKASKETALRGLEHAYRAKADRDMLKVFVEYVPDAVLTYAAALGYEDLVATLLGEGAKIESEVIRRSSNRSSSASALVEACAKGHLAIAKQLIDKGADVNAECGQSFGSSYALPSAARRGYTELVKLLLTHGADVNSNGGYGPALSIAAFEGHDEIVRILIEHGALLDDGNGSYGGPVQAAVLGDHVDILKFILAAGADVNMLAGTARITGSGVALSDSPIQAAVRSSNIPMVDFLLERGADPNLCQNDSSRWHNYGPPLSIAAKAGDLNLVNRLLDIGANVNQTTETQRESGPALYWAVKGGFLTVVNRLIDAGADPNLPYKTSAGSEATILAEACMGKNAQVVEALLKAGANIKMHSKLWGNGEPPIHTAARCGHVDIIGVLAKYGADINEQIEEGYTALHKAARAGRPEIVKVLLLELGADPSLSLLNGSLPIHTAASWNSPECLELLVTVSDINARNKTGRTPLHWAADNEAPKAIEWLLVNGADVGIKEDGTNMTARDYAELRLLEADSYRKQSRADILEIFDRHAEKQGGDSSGSSDTLVD